MSDQPMQAEFVTCEHEWSWHSGPTIAQGIAVATCMLCGHLRAEFSPKDHDDTLLYAIEKALNRASAENPSGSPDFVLAEYLLDCLAAFDKAVIRRGEWRGQPAEFKPEVGMTREQMQAALDERKL